jgi:hypothetical protein
MISSHVYPDFGACINKKGLLTLRGSMCINYIPYHADSDDLGSCVATTSLITQLLQSRSHICSKHIPYHAAITI